MTFISEMERFADVLRSSGFDADTPTREESQVDWGRHQDQEALAISSLVTGENTHAIAAALN